MKRLFESANLYLRKSTWKDLAMIKFCLFSMGIIVGILLKEDFTKIVFICALFVFVITYIPLMMKYYRVFKETK